MKNRVKRGYGYFYPLAINISRFVLKITFPLFRTAIDEGPCAPEKSQKPHEEVANAEGHPGVENAPHGPDGNHRKITPSLFKFGIFTPDIITPSS